MTPEDGAPFWLTDQDVANVVARIGRKRKRMLDTVLYVAATDSLLFVAMPFMLLLPRKTIPDLQMIPREALSELELSPAGTTISLESYDISIEVAGLLARHFNEMQKRRSGGVFMDFFRKHDSAE
jgi:hypothetical protein